VEHLIDLFIPPFFSLSFFWQRKKERGVEIRKWAPFDVFFFLTHNKIEIKHLRR